MNKLLMTSSNNKKIISLFILFSPIVYNYFFKLLPRETRNLSLYNPDFMNLLLSLLLTLSLVYIGSQIKIALGLTNISVSVVCYLFSFFIFDTFFLFLTKHFDLIYTFTFVNVFWIIVIILRTNINKKAFILFVLLLIFFRQYIFELISSNFSLTPTIYTVPEESKVWLPSTTNIYEDNYFIGLKKQTSHSGYGLLISHINAVSTLIFSKSHMYYFYPFIKNIYYFLTLLFIYEIKSSKVSKIFFIFLFTLVSLNSHWFRYIFFNSLMMESGVSYFFGVVMYSFVNVQTRKQKYIYSLLLGFLYFSKQFVAALAILFIFYALYKKIIHLRVFIISFSGVIFSFFNFLVLGVHLTWINYIRFFDSSTNEESTYNYTNFKRVVEQFLIDRPLTYLLLAFFILFLFNSKNHKTKYIDFIRIILLNTALVFILYIFAWGSEESADHIGSSYRYFLNIFHLMIPIFLESLDNFIYRKQVENIIN